MQKSQLIQQLKQINLNLDHQTIEAVQIFLINDIGFLNDIQPEFQLYGGVAIVSEIQTLPTIGQNIKAKNGIRIQNVMSHLGKLSKQKFLDTINRQLEKFKKAPSNLKKKVEDIRYSYRFYKKYQTTFQQLYKGLSISCDSKEQFSALFWVVFLYIKNSCIETQNITESKCFFILLFRMIFENFLAKAQFEKIFPIMEEHIGKIPQISLQKYNFYLHLVEQKISGFYSQRFSQVHVNFDKLLNNYTFVERLLDDMSNAYVKEQVQLKFYNEIDELSYLELKKNITPQVFRKIIVVDQPQFISTELLFGDDDDFGDEISEQLQNQIQGTPQKTPIIEGTDGQSTPKPNYTLKNTVSPYQTPKPKWDTVPEPKILSSQFNDDIFGATPISKKIQNENWLNKRISQVTNDQIQQFLEFSQTLQNDPDLIVEESQQISSSSLSAFIIKLIKEYTPKCQNYEQRRNKVMAFTIANFAQIQIGNHSIFTGQNSGYDKKQAVMGIATLSCQIFNYIHNSVSFAFKHHCQVFGIDAKTAFQTFNFFNLEIKQTMPIDLKDYLQKTIKRFFVDEIWQDGQGYTILCQTSPVSQFAQIRLKILSLSEGRVKQICRQANIDAKIISKTQNMMKYIFEKKPYLLRRNNIDQIILCCIMSCLSINEKEQHKTLELLFSEYNSNIQFAFNSNQLGLKDGLGKQMKIVDYYNEVFLLEIQDMLADKQNQLDDFLITPVRITNVYQSSNIQKALDKKRQLPGAFQFNPEKQRDKKMNYRQNLLRMSMGMQEEDENEDEELQSPKFSMKKTFTFGGWSEK